MYVKQKINVNMSIGEFPCNDEKLIYNKGNFIWNVERNQMKKTRIECSASHIENMKHLI